MYDNYKRLQNYVTSGEYQLCPWYLPYRSKISISFLIIHLLTNGTQKDSKMPDALHSDINFKMVYFKFCLYSFIGKNKRLFKTRNVKKINK